MKYFISPHNDDETLFGAFTIQREKPNLIVVFDSYLQVDRGHAECDFETRRLETQRAMQQLGLEEGKITFLGFKDNDPAVAPAHVLERILEVIGPNDVEQLWVPAVEDYGHHQHNLVGQAFSTTKRVKRYLTYTNTGKSTVGHVVPILDGRWIQNKLRALACYDTQLLNPRLGCCPHFLREQTEYYAL